jgi:GTP-binding protein HflX
VELAQMEYQMPRLTRGWTHLVRQGGGIGARGEGETQLEQDKRRIRGNIDRCKRDLETVREARATQRKDRKRTPVPNAAIVGYTNAGKSSLLRRLTGADVLVEDKLFATLDTTTRKIALPNKQPLLLTDTVGFVRKLPHRLVEAFHATLEESVLADFLIHLLDASQPQVMNFYDTTRRVLAELGADEKRTLIVFNKIDKVADDSTLAVHRRHFPDALFISVHTGEGIDELVARMGEMADGGAVTCDLRVPQREGALLANIHRLGRILHTDYEGDTVLLTAVLPARLAESCGAFIVGGTDKSARPLEPWVDDKA